MFFFTCMCLCVSICMWVGFPGPEEGFRTPGAGITSSCDLPHICAGNQTQVLCKSRSGSYLLTEPVAAMKTLVLRTSFLKKNNSSAPTPLMIAPALMTVFHRFSCWILLFFSLSLSQLVDNPFRFGFLWLSSSWMMRSSSLFTVQILPDVLLNNKQSFLSLKFICF